jgi:hypothetical protein
MTFLMLAAPRLQGNVDGDLSNYRLQRDYNQYEEEQETSLSAMPSTGPEKRPIR